MFGGLLVMTRQNEWQDNFFDQIVQGQLTLHERLSPS